MEREFVLGKFEWLRPSSTPLIPPEGIRFCPQIRFDNEGKGMPNWTAEVIIREWLDEGCYADLRYLFEKAPQEFLKPGNIFTLFDGPKEIARGELLKIE